jgi:dTDP-4-dehydrorhamnose reductase
MRLLVTGVAWQVARALKAREGGALQVSLLGRPQLDLADAGDLRALFAGHAPDVVVSAAAYTQVDKAEAETDLAYKVNADGAGAVARAAAAIGAPVIHLSTDYVFDGAAPRRLAEDEPTGPVNAYGASKLAGEQQVALAAPDHAILRTAWVYAPQGGNFVRTMLRVAKTNPELRVVNDQHGVPTSALDIAAAVEAVARNLKARPGDPSLRGVFHMTASGPTTTWAEFAVEIFRLSAERGGPSARVAPIPSSDYPTAARRPAWSSLDPTKLAERHGATLPDWRGALARVVDQIAAEGWP